MTWQVYNGDRLITVANGGDVSDGSKYSVSTNPSTGLYYRLHILTVGVSDVKEYRCEAVFNGAIRYFYFQLIFIGRCNYILVIIKLGTSFIFSW